MKISVREAQPTKKTLPVVISTSLVLLLSTVVRSILVLSAVVSLLADHVFGQTISVSGVNVTTTPGSTVGDKLTLTISGANSIGNVESVNILMSTPSSGVHSGVGFFTMTIPPMFIAPFTQSNGVAGTSSFSLAGDANNAGFTMSDRDVGDNAPAASAAPVASSGTTTIPFETLNFHVAANTPAGVYNFRVGLGGAADIAQGSFIDNSGNRTFGVNSEPTFTITIGSAGADKWTDSTGNWFTAANWSAGVPQSTTNAVISGTSSVVTVNGAGTVHNLTLSSGAKLTIPKADSLKIGGSFTQSGGKTTDNGSLSASGGVSLKGGSLFGTGSITGAVTSSSAGIISPGASSPAVGILKEMGTYTQNSGRLDIAINGTTAGTQFDQFNPTKGVLSGTLDILRPTGFVPTIGSTFKIMNFTSETGTFSTVNGTAINSSEHFVVAVQPTDVLVKVVSGAAAQPAVTGQVNAASRVPEQGFTLPLLLIGLFSCAVFHWRSTSRRFV
jgi:hypothetical protein